MGLRTWTRVNGTTSGTLSHYVFGGFEWQVTNSDADRIANNRSVVRVRMFGGRNSSNYNGYNLTDNTSYIMLDQQYNQTTRWDFRNATVNRLYYVGTDTSIFPKGNEQEATIYHKTNGTQNIVISSFFDGHVPGFTRCDTSSIIALPTIPRASNVSATNGDIEGSTTITISRASSSFKHTLSYSFGNINDTIATNVDTSYIWTIPESFYEEIPNSPSGICTITCETYDGASLIGTKTTTFTATVNYENNKPTVFGSVSDNSAMVDLTNDPSSIVKYYSNGNYSISATAKNYATITSYKATCGNKSLTTASGVLEAVESGTFVFEATDSRGYKNTHTVELDFANYVRPTIIGEIQRPNPTSNYGHFKINGFAYFGNFGVHGNTNNINYKYRYKESGGTYSSYATVPEGISSDTEKYWCADYIMLEDFFDYEKSYVVEFVIEDSITSQFIEFILTNGIPIFHWGKDDVTFEKDVIIKGDTYIDDSEDTLLEKLSEKANADVCRIYRSADYNLVINGAYNHYPTYPFNEVASNTNLSKMELNGSGIKILTPCSFVLVSVVLNIDLVNESVQINLVKNGSTIFTVDSSRRNNMTSIEIPPFLVSASQNDVFTITIGASAGRTYLTRGTRSSFQVQILK